MLTQFDKDFFVASPGRDWILRHRGQEFCDYCNKVNRTLYPRGIDILLNLENGAPPITTQNTLCIGIISKELKTAILPWLGELAFGRCFDVEGRLIESFESFYTDLYVTPVSTDRFCCSRCGVVTAQWGVPPKLYHRDVRDREVLVTASCEVLVSERVRVSVNWRLFPEIELVPFELV